MPLRIVVKMRRLFLALAKKTKGTTVAAAAALSTSSNVSSGIAAEAPAFIVSVEWNPKVSMTIIEQQQQQEQKLSMSSSSSTAPSVQPDYLVYPDLPNLYTHKDRTRYIHTSKPEQRIQTVAVCQHSDAKSLLDCVYSMTNGDKNIQTNKEEEATKDIVVKNILLVGGNDKKKNNEQSHLSTIEATQILLEAEGSELYDDNTKIKLWGVCDPNDPSSIEYMQQKVDAGITSFLTQPLLSSHALDVLQEYPRRTSTASAVTSSSSSSQKIQRQKQRKEQEIILLAGIAMPRTVKNLHFWADKLIDRINPPLCDDPLFQSHIAYFSQPYVTPLAWTLREIQNLLTLSSSLSLSPSPEGGERGMARVINGIHLMPMKNPNDLTTIIRLLSPSRHQGGG